MIPSLVFITAQGHHQETLDTLADLVYLLKHPELPIPSDELIASFASVLKSRGHLGRLLPLALRPLVPTQRAPSVVSEFLTIIEPHQLVPGMKSLADGLSVIDLCEECGRAWDERAQAAARLQSVEYRLLLEYTCRAAQGEN